MAWLPIANVPPQYDFQGEPASGFVLKFYRVGTTTNILLATDNTGGTTATDTPLNAEGFPEISGTVIIPHIEESYKVALYPTQAAADADSGFLWAIDNLTPPVNSVNSVDELVKVSANDTTAATLDTKVVSGTNITVTEESDGGNENLSVNLIVNEHILPSVDATYNLGSATFQFNVGYFDNIIANNDAAVGGNLTVTGSINGVNTLVLDIGDWDMDATAAVAISHGLNVANIRNYKISIRDDIGVLYDVGNDFTSGTMAHTFITVSAVNIQRIVSGLFDSTSFDTATSYNRGWITIQYID